MINKIQINIFLIFLSLFCSVLVGAKKVDKNNTVDHPWSQAYSGSSLGKIGQYGFPSNPMNDRARGYLLKGKAQAAITNYGRIVDWDHHPPGLWGNFTYLPAVGFVTGMPGQSYTYNYEWYECPGIDHSANDFIVWCSSEAYSDPNNTIPGFSWYEDSDTNFVSIVFDAYNDRGILGDKLCSPYEIDNGSCFNDDGDPISVICNFTDIEQFCIDNVNQYLMISLEKSTDSTIDPNNSNVYGDNLLKKGVGLVYPWAMRADLKQRLDDFDLYDYGEDQEEWTEDDEYVYYGANTAESWFTRWNPSSNTDWHASTKARENTHNTLVNESDIYGDVNYLNTGTYPILAHSENSSTWPTDFNEDGEIVPVWPGWHAESYDPEGANNGEGCFPAKRYNDDCWVKTNRFISDNDIYFEFDDRWAHRGNMVTNNEYEQTGYPTGMRVMAEAHSYGISFAEDIIFVTVQVRNESGDWCAFERDRSGNKIYLTENDGEGLICGDAMVMPDGTKLNQGKGFDYKSTSMGFYMDADVVTSNKFGSFGVHSNDDDFMEYYDCKDGTFCPGGLSLNPDGCCEVINDDTLRVSIAMIYDYSGGPPEDIGIVATQLLDSPYATVPVDLNYDGINDIYPGDKLKMTDWHWFSWYNRPGVVYQEGDAGCCAGDPGSSQAINKEEIMYKIIAGDTTNLSANEKDWFFHTADPGADNHENDLNPHFDSLQGLDQTSFFSDDPDGLDCVLQMSSGPFSLEVGEQAPFSFCIIFGQNYDDLIDNATFAQLMYNSHYQGYTSPDTPVLTATIGEENLDEDWYDGQHHCINLSWDDSAESSSDVVTGYSDFEGYNIYRSEDGGQTWGNPSTDLYDVTDPDSWVPYQTFHLTEDQDRNHCTFANDYHGECSISFPEYYILEECVVGCVDQDDIEENCKDSAWIECIENSSCTLEVECDNPLNPECTSECTGQFESGLCIVYDRRLEVSDYDLLKDTDQDVYKAVFGVVNCDIFPWCNGGELCDDGIPDIRGYNICGLDVHNPIAGPDALGDCEAYIDDTNQEIGIKHSFLDCNVIDGMEYTYTVTAFDTGIPPDYTSEFLEDYGIYNQTLNLANPLHFASPDGYQSIHSSRGRTNTDQNFVTVESGSNPTQNISNNINVVPNPYFVHSAFNETEYSRKIRFTHLPEKCKISIFTISGEKVITLNHEDGDDGNHWWNLRTVNNQEVAPGLYVYAVENLTSGYEHEKFIGKFAIVR